MISNLFCGNCKALQAPDKGNNYFKIMGIKESYDLDEIELANKYKNLQKYLHPDKFATRDKMEQEISAQYSSLVNEAYKTLLEPLARGIYMLHLRGKKIPEKTEIDKEFLMKIMEKNEEVENAASKAEIMQLNEENKTVIKDLQRQVSSAFFDVNSERYLDKVIQGSPTSIAKYPVLAQLLLDAWGSQEYLQHCAGIILTSRHVLSAAHCFQYNENTKRKTRGGAMHKLKTIITHEDFNKYYYTNDIAIVIVSKQFTFNNNVKQSTIIKQGVEINVDSPCQLVGWGVLEPDGPQPDQLQHTILNIIDHKTCEYRYSTIGAVIQDSMMCAGRLDTAGPDGCFGDSGGPLFYKGLVVGLVSFGYSCGHKYYPGVYTKVSHFTNWVVNTVKKNK
ncbi:unnamed protein product [Arctia plantaginis]|uniref:Uncharacterized protein n=1 Tax=Arctia plantaginis TaxID=874455 RepID=A0A8S0YR16_ARCPL|nr:unnamed protein product [Arctia plantaginis]